MNYPFDDQIMQYDYTSHRYVLTEKGVESELGVNLNLTLNPSLDANPTTLVMRTLKRVSQDVYAYLYRDSMSPQWLEYILATYAPLRDDVKEMLQAQLLYTLENGFVADYSGVNVARGQAMDINVLRGRARIAPQVEDIANRTVQGLGYCLKFLGQLPCVPCEAYRRGY